MSHYETLGVSDQSEYAIIRSKYRAAILALHPDKASNLRNQSAEESEDEVLNEIASFVVVGGDEGDEVASRFLRVQKAWEVLRDPESRAAYDRALLAERFASRLSCLGGDLTAVIGENICLADMSLSMEDSDGEENAEFSYPCRCGDFYVVSRTELCRVADELIREMDVGKRQHEKSGTCSQDSAKVLEQSESGVSTESSSKFREKFGGLVLPCQSCSLHIRLQDVILIKEMTFVSSWIMTLLSDDEHMGNPWFYMRFFGVVRILLFLEWRGIQSGLYLFALSSVLAVKSSKFRQGFQQFLASSGLFAFSDSHCFIC